LATPVKYIERGREGEGLLWIEKKLKKAKEQDYTPQTMAK